MNEENINILQKKKEHIIEINEINSIKRLIYTVRDKQVMLDIDVANLYHYPTKRINETVRRNIQRFPSNFCFQLTESEVENMWSQFATTYKNMKYRSEKYLPYAFTEQGIAMLSGLLKNEIAIQVSINIMNAFVEMRRFIANNSNVFNRLITVEYKLLEHDKKFNEVFNELQKDNVEEFKQKLFFNGQIYDAYSLIIDIIKSAKKNILIIDNYIDDTVLKMLIKKNKNVEVIILTSDKSNISKLDIQKFNKEYPVLKVAKSDKFHDRFILIDNKELYHCGASIKDLGKKCFGINKIEDKTIIDKIINL